MEQFITWYCSEPRLSLNRAVVLRFRPVCTWNPSDSLPAQSINGLHPSGGLPTRLQILGCSSPELTAGIRRVKGGKQLGSRIGNWLTHDRDENASGKS